MKIQLSRLKVLGGLFLAGMLSVPALAATKTAEPGSLNYVEGQVSVGNEPVNAQAVGNLTLQSGQTLSTSEGRAEVLLTPGVFLRLDNESSVQMNSLSLINTEIVLNEGRAMVEADQVRPQNDLRVVVGGMPIMIEKNGLYEFDAADGKILVYKGQARLLENQGDEHITIDGGHQVDLKTQDKLKSHDFDKKAAEDTDLYRWSSLRSSYLAEANVDAARTYYADGYYGSGWIGPGWYWDPWYSAYTFIPGDGFFYSPFGWGFFSPIVVFRSPFFFGGFGPHFVHTFATFHGQAFPGRVGVAGGFRPGFGGHGVAGGGAGGFHGGSMGFHGGGGGMGSHGGGMHR